MYHGSISERWRSHKRVACSMRIDLSKQQRLSTHIFRSWIWDRCSDYRVKTQPRSRATAWRNLFVTH
jgi:hypothetical protein